MIFTTRRSRNVLNKVLILVFLLFLGIKMCMAVESVGKTSSNGLRVRGYSHSPQKQGPVFLIAKSDLASLDKVFRSNPNFPQASTTTAYISLYRYILEVTAVTAVGFVFLLLWFWRKQRTRSDSLQDELTTMTATAMNAKKNLKDSQNIQSRLALQISTVYAALITVFGAEIQDLEDSACEIAAQKLEQLSAERHEAVCRAIRHEQTLKQAAERDVRAAMPVKDAKQLETIIRVAEHNPLIAFPQGVKIQEGPKGQLLYVRNEQVELRAAVYLVHGTTNLKIRTRVTFLLDEWLTYGEVVSKLRTAGQSLAAQSKNEKEKQNV